MRGIDGGRERARLIVQHGDIGWQQRVADLQQATKASTRQRGSDIITAERNRVVSGGPAHVRADGVGGVTDDQCPATDTIDIDASISPGDDLNVGECGELTDQLLLLILRLETGHSPIGGEADVQLSDPVSEFIDLVDGCDDALICVAAESLKTSDSRAESRRNGLARQDDILARHRVGGTRGEPGPAVEELIEPGINAAGPGGDGGFDRANALGDRGVVFDASRLDLQPAVDQAIALRADPLYLDAFASREAGRGGDGREVDHTPGVARGVRIRNVVTGDVEPDALCFERSCGQRQNAE